MPAHRKKKPPMAIMEYSMPQVLTKLQLMQQTAADCRRSELLVLGCTGPCVKKGHQCGMSHPASQSPTVRSHPGVTSSPAATELLLVPYFI